MKLERMLQAEVDRLRRELDDLRYDHDNRRARVAIAVEDLRKTFTLRPDCSTIGDAVEDACLEHRDVKYAYAAYRAEMKKKPQVVTFFRPVPRGPR